MTADEFISNEFFTEEQMAKLLGFKNLKSLKNRRYVGKDVPPHVVAGANVLYPVESFRKWLKSKEQRQNKRAS